VEAQQEAQSPHVNVSGGMVGGITEWAHPWHSFSVILYRYKTCNPFQEPEMTRPHSARRVHHKPSASMYTLIDW
jgi:hypothetical protein